MPWKASRVLFGWSMDQTTAVRAEDRLGAEEPKNQGKNVSLFA